MIESMYPINDKIVVQPIEDEKEHVTDGGILLPDVASTGGLMKGKVLEVSPGMYSHSGEVIPMTVMRGQVVLYGKQNSGQEYKLNGNTVLIMSQNDVLAHVSEK